MIVTATIDAYAIHRANNTYVEDWGGLGLPEVRQVRQARPRAHGAIDATSLYGPRVMSVQGWCGDADGWGSAAVTAAATAFDTLKQKLSVEASHLVVLRRAGLAADEQLTARLASDVQATYLGGGEVIRWGFDLVAGDPRLYATSLSTSQRTGAGSWSPNNTGTYSAPWVLTVVGPSNAGTLDVTDTSITNAPFVRVTLPALAAAATADIDLGARTVFYAGAYHPEAVSVSVTSWYDLAPGSNTLTAAGTALAAGTVVRASWRHARM